MTRGIIEEEINKCIMVWSTVVMSSCYCYGTTKLVPKGTIRLFLFLPVVSLFLFLPLSLNTISFSIPTAFFVTWLATFKLLLLVFGAGPLSNPSLSLIQFVFISCLPINLQNPVKPIKYSNKENDPKDRYKIGPRTLLSYAEKGLLLIFLIFLAGYKDKVPQNIHSFLICIYIYNGIEVLLGIIAIVAQISLQTRIEQPFDCPYLSTSLQDFWGRRWNRVASNSLRSTIFDPTIKQTRGVLSQQWAVNLALIVTFIMSDLMHEIIFYNLGRVKFGWGTPLFFLMQGVLVSTERMLKRKIDAKWRLPQVIVGPLIFGFVILTFMWLVLPELLEHNVDDRALQEYSDLAAYVKDLGLLWTKMGYNLLVPNLQPNSSNSIQETGMVL